MNKIFLTAFTVILGSGVAIAQESDSLFPELAGQFERPSSSETTVDLSVEQNSDTKIQAEQKSSSTPKLPQNAQDPDSNTPTNRQDEKVDTGEKAEGNLVIEVQNVDGVLPYARTLAYCRADAVLINETNMRLEQLSITATYKDMPKELNYSNVSKGKKRTQNFMLIGLPCESITTMPNVEIKACKLGTLSESDCKKRVQFIPPSG